LVETIFIEFLISNGTLGQARNPNIEILRGTPYGGNNARNAKLPKSKTPSHPALTRQKAGLVHLKLGNLDLFRVSDFVLRILFDVPLGLRHCSALFSTEGCDYGAEIVDFKSLPACRKTLEKTRSRPIITMPV
jgi:hypothetical protein